MFINYFLRLSIASFFHVGPRANIQRFVTIILSDAWCQFSFKSLRSCNSNSFFFFEWVKSARLILKIKSTCFFQCLFDSVTCGWWAVVFFPFSLICFFNFIGVFDIPNLLVSSWMDFVQRYFIIFIWNFLAMNLRFVQNSKSFNRNLMYTFWWPTSFFIKSGDIIFGNTRCFLSFLYNWIKSWLSFESINFWFFCDIVEVFAMHIA